MSFEYHEPTSLAEAVDLGARFGADGRFLAGGTDLIIQVRRGKVAPRHVISLHRVPGLDAIEANGSVRLGALVTHRTIERCAAFRGRLRGLIEGAEVVGGHQVRNVGTVGGNVVNASPAADSPPALLAYDAELELVSTSGSRWLPYQGFHTGYKSMLIRPDELLTRIRLPRQLKGRHHYYRKVGTRKAQAISKVCFAASARMNDDQIADIRIALGSVAPIPIRCIDTEATLRNQRLSRRLIEEGKAQLAKEIAPIDDVRSTRDYRLQVSLNLLGDFLLQLERQGV